MVHVHELSDLRRKGESLHYRREYSATAKVQYLGEENAALPVSFTIEQNALGNKEISVQVAGDLDYPKLPLIRAIREHIRELDGERKLP